MSKKKITIIICTAVIIILCAATAMVFTLSDLVGMTLGEAVSACSSRGIWTYKYENFNSTKVSEEIQYLNELITNLCAY